MLERISELLYLMAPAYAANMAPPVLARYWKGWNRPISRRWLGAHKTVLGFAAGVLAAIVTAALQRALGWEGSLVDYGEWLPLGAALGASALAGDALKSFLKRRLHIAPGEPWIPADQLDFVLGALVVAVPWAGLGLQDVALIVALSVAGDVAVNQAAWFLGIRTTRW